MLRLILPNTHPLIPVPNVFEVPNHYLLPQVTIFEFTNNTDQDVLRLVLLPVYITMFIADRPSNRHVRAVDDADALVDIMAFSKADGSFMDLFTLKKSRDCVWIVWF